MASGGALQFKRAQSHENNKIEPLAPKALDKKDYPPGKFVDNRAAPDVDQLRRELANKNR